MIRKQIIQFILILFGAGLLYGCGGQKSLPGEQKQLQNEQVELQEEQGVLQEEQGGLPGEQGASQEEQQGAGGNGEMQQQSGAVTFTDALGYEVTVDHPAKTAVISGSYADMWQLAGGELAAITKDAEDTITVTKEMVNLGDLKSPSVEMMIAEEIDFVILSAVIAEHVGLRDQLEAAGITTAYFEVETFEDYAAMMDILTDITGKKDLYQTNVEMLREEIAAQIARADGSSPTVLLLRAFSGGVKSKGSDSMTGQMLKDLGCVNIADSEKGLLEELSMEAIIAADPDYIFVTTMGESQEAALNMVDELLISNPAWNGLKAVKENHYYVLEKELFHIKPNERWGESYRILADYLYGDE
jgi:iron complex transport system substrate-binding protein